jgi:phenylacetate-CoA ligase
VAPSLPAIETPQRRGPLARATGTLTILRSLPGQQRALFVPRKELEARRDRRVRETVLYAARHVPFYRDLFRGEGLDPRDIGTANDLSRLPLVPREEVLADPRRFRSDAPGTGDGVTLRSSGTTGVPLNVFHDRGSVLANVAHSERERAVEATVIGKRLRYTRAYLGLAGPENVNRIRGLMDAASYRPLRPRHVTIATDQPFEGVLAALDALRPDVLAGSGSYLESLFQGLVESGGRFHRPLAVLYAWDHMTDAGREHIESLGVPVLSRYSAMESLKIGFLCEQRRSFHLHEDLCHVEIADRDGSNAPPGHRGEIVISNLVNRGTVLLRYRLGDLGALSNEPCPCGRSARLLVDFGGRVSEIVRLPDGSPVDPLALAVAVRAPGVTRYQLVQVGPRRFQLRLQTSDRATYERVVADVLAAVRSVLRGLEVEASHEDAIEPEPGRKFRPVVLL